MAWIIALNRKDIIIAVLILIGTASGHVWVGDLHEAASRELRIAKVTSVSGGAVASRLGLDCRLLAISDILVVGFSRQQLIRLLSDAVRLACTASDSDRAPIDRLVDGCLNATILARSLRIRAVRVVLDDIVDLAGRPWDAI